MKEIQSYLFRIMTFVIGKYDNIMLPAASLSGARRCGRRPWRVSDHPLPRSCAPSGPGFPPSLKSPPPRVRPPLRHHAGPRALLERNSMVFFF